MTAGSGAASDGERAHAPSRTPSPSVTLNAQSWSPAGFGVSALGFPAIGYTGSMATTRQTRTARSNVRKAQKAATAKKSISSMPAATRTALGKQGAAVAARKRHGGSTPKTRAELYEMAKERDIAGRSKMGRDELARRLGVT